MGQNQQEIDRLNKAVKKWTEGTFDPFTKMNEMVKDSDSVHYSDPDITGKLSEIPKVWYIS